VKYGEGPVRGSSRIHIGAGISAVGLALLAACLPSLDANAPTPPPAGTRPFCGDGLIRLPRGPGTDDAGTDDAGVVAKEACDPTEAGALGCTRGCAIDCASGYVDPDTNHCYQAGAKASSYKDAIDECATMGAHVVTFSGDDERNKVLDAGLGGSDLFWVGLAQDPTALAYTAAAIGEPGWAQGSPLPCTGCFAKVGTNTQIPKKPDAGGGQLPCVGDGKGQGTWFQIPASLPNPSTGAIGVLCEREPPGRSHEPCEAGACIAIKDTAGRKRYVVPAHDGTAAEAAALCKTLGPVGRLVVLETREERETLMKEVARILADTTDTGVWIGLSRASGAASWVWDNGSDESSYPILWGDKEPKPSAPPVARAYVGLDSKDYDIQLAHADAPETRRPFVCEY
jgi:Lectin C-type domain